MKRRYNYRCYRHPRTTQEKRANQDSPYVRGKRLPSNLADPWDDLPIFSRKSWKDKRKTQYRVGRRGKQHSITLDGKSPYRWLWQLEEYFQNHDIPFNIEAKHQCETRVKTFYYKHKFIGYAETQLWHDSQKTWQRPVYENIKVYFSKPHFYRVCVSTKYVVTWWSNKDIGIDYVLKLCG